MFFQDEYQHLDNTGTRVGPIVHRLGLNIAELDSKTIDLIFDKDPHGIPSSASNASSAKSTGSAPIKLQHPLELFLLEYAAEYLKTQIRQTAVLVDIIVRDETGRILLDSNKPEIHTVLLCRTPKADEYLVIDPNKVSHSSHIANQGVYDRNFSIVIVNKMPDIYTGQKNNTGPGADQFRDCIDVATKLALGLNYANKPLSANSLDANEVLQMVSNNTDIDKTAFDVIRKNPVRIKQRSDVELMQKFYQLEGVLKKDLTMLGSIDVAKTKIREKEYQNILLKVCTADNYSNITNELVALDFAIRNDTKVCLGDDYISHVDILKE